MVDVKKPEDGLLEQLWILYKFLEERDLRNEFDLYKILYEAEHV